jgi:hypothetical protein
MYGFIFDGDSKKDNLLSFFNVVTFRVRKLSVIVSVSVSVLLSFFNVVTFRVQKLSVKVSVSV